jgi:hypothetical protein
LLCSALVGLRFYFFFDWLIGWLVGCIFVYSGVGQLEVSGGVPGIPLYDDYIEMMKELKNPIDIEYLGKVFPNIDHVEWRTSETDLSPPRLDEADFLNPVTSTFAPLVYEAVIALGLSACAASQETLAFTGPSHFEHFKASRFTSFGGSVYFDPITGTRDSNSHLYKVTNYDYSDEGSFDNVTGGRRISFSKTITHLYQNSTWVQVQPYIFNDGTSNLAPDLPPVIPEERFNLPLLIGIPAAVTVILMLLVFLFYEHQRKQNDSVWHVKKEELKFPEQQVVIGSGTFGVVLMAEYRGTQVAVKRVIPPSGRHGTGDALFSTAAGTATIVVGDETEGNEDPYHSEDPNALHSNTMGMQSGSAVSVHSQSTATGGWKGHGGGSHSGSGLTSGMGLTSGTNSGMISSKRLPAAGLRSVGFGVKSMVDAATGSSSDAAIRKRLKQEFMEEMRYLSKLRHPCITTVMGTCRGVLLDRVGLQH